MPIERTRPLRLGWGVAGVLAAVLAVAATVDAGPGIVDQKSGHLVVGETDLALPAGGVLLELRRIASSGDEGGGILGPRWRLSVDKRVPASPAETTRDVESGREVYRADGRLARIDMGIRGTVTLSYDALGRLTAITGPTGAAIRLTLDRAGRLVHAETTEGAVAEYRYLNGLLSEVQVRGRAPARYSYDALRRLSRIDDPLGGPTAITYDASHRVVLRRFADGSTESIAYDDARREVRVTDASGGITTTVRSADGLEDVTLDPSGRRTEIRYDPRGRPLRVAVEGREPVQTAYDPLGRISSTGAAGRQLRYEYVGDTMLVSALVFPDGSRYAYSYDANQQLLALRERDETLLAFSYTDNGLPASIRKRGEPEVRYVYRPDGRLASESDSTGRTWQYDYDTRGNLIRERFNGRLKAYEYDSQDRLIGTTDPAGATTRYTLDAAGRRTRIADALGGTTQFEYDASGRVTSETDAAGRATRYRYDMAGRVTDITYPGGGTRSFAYGRAGSLLRAVNPVGGVTRYDYDASGQLVRVTDPVDRVWTYEYSAPGQVGTIVGPDGHAADVRYDQQRRRTGWTDDAGTSVELERDAQGRVGVIRMPGGVVHTITYDNAGRPVAEETSLTPKVERQFDEAGRVTMVRNATGAQTSYRYDASGALAEVKESAGAALTYEYDARGLRSAAKDAQGHVSRFGYDLLGRLTQVTGPGPGSRRLSYSAAGDLEQVQDANGDAVHLDYDAAGQLRRVVHPSGAATEFERDAFGNPVKITGPLGEVTRFTYDGAGRLSSEVDPAGGGTSYRYDAAGRRSETRLKNGTSVKYLYDGAGRQTSVDDGAFPVRYAYDAAGRRRSIEYPAVRASLGYEYNATGQLVTLRAPDGREIGYSYDAHKRLAAITLPGSQTIRLEYDPAGFLTGMVYPNGVRGSWQRDQAGRLLNVAYTDASGRVIDGRGYEYDAAGQVVRMRPASGAPSEYRYDPSGQLIEETTGDAAVRYAYLPGGDRAVREAGGQTTAYAYDEAGRLVKAGAEDFAYDALGNTVRRGAATGATSYSWDAANRLERVVLADGRDVRYGYAATGDRAWRQDSSGKTWFVTDGVNLIADLDEALRVQSLYVHAPGVDRPLAVITARGTQFYHSNALGSITSVTGANGTVLASYAYDAFGTPTETRGPGVTRFLHAAREYDSDTGLYYVRARYYDPRLGRFLSVDPRWADWSDPLSLNRYAYVRNAPTRHVDLSGERAFPTPADIWTAWGLTPTQWNDILLRSMVEQGLPNPDAAWTYAELATITQSAEYTGGEADPYFPQTQQVKGQALYEKVVQRFEKRSMELQASRARIEAEAMRQLDERLERAAAARQQPRPGPAAEPPPPVDSEGRSRSLGRPPSDPNLAQRAGAARATGEQAPQYRPPPDSPELHSPTVKSPVPGAAAEVVKGPRASTFGPQSRMSTLDADGRSAAGAGLGALATGLSIATDVENGRDIGRSVKEHALGAVASAVMIGVPLSYAATGTGVVATVAAAGSAVLGPAAVAYGGYRYASAVAARPEREANARAQQQLEVNSALAGPSLAELRNLVERETGELQALKNRYDEASASVTANAAGIRERATRIDNSLAALRAAVQSSSRPAGAVPQFKDQEDALAAKVQEANALADACAGEADASKALAAHAEAVERSAAIVRQAGATLATLAAPPRTATDVAGLRDSIVGDTSAIIGMQRRLEADWSSLPGIKGQFDAKRAALMNRIQGVRAALPVHLTPNQQGLFDRLTRDAQGTQLPERPTDVSESPGAIQKLAGAAVQAKLDAQDLAARAAAEPSESPRTAAEAAGASARAVLASAEGVPAKVQACRARLSGAPDAPKPPGGDNKALNDDTKPPQKDTPPQPQPSSSGFQAGATQAGPAGSSANTRGGTSLPGTDTQGGATPPAAPGTGGFGVGATTAGRDPAQPPPPGGGGQPGGSGSGGQNPQRGTQPPGPPQTRAVAGQPAAYHIFATGSRMGWASGLGQYSIGPADPSIVEHLQVAGEHMMWANRESYLPVKAWPNWTANRAEVRSWADGLVRDPRNPTRRQISVSANSRAGTLADALRYQTMGAPEHAATCDAAYMSLGYELGYSQQTLGIADEAARNGDRVLAREARQDGRSHLQNSSRILSDYERIVSLTGRCADLRDVKTQLDAIFRIDVGDLSGQSRSTTAAWTLALERIRMLSGQVSSGASQPANPAPAAQGPVNLLPLTSISLEGGIYQVGTELSYPHNPGRQAERKTYDSKFVFLPSHSGQFVGNQYVAEWNQIQESPFLWTPNSSVYGSPQKKPCLSKGRVAVTFDSTFRSILTLAMEVQNSSPSDPRLFQTFSLNLANIPIAGRASQTDAYYTIEGAGLCSRGTALAGQSQDIWGGSTWILEKLVSFGCQGYWPNMRIRFSRPK